MIFVVDGGFGEWGQWTPCNSNCVSDESRVIRSRTCDSPAADFGGASCSSYTETQESIYCECSNNIVGVVRHINCEPINNTCDIITACPANTYLAYNGIESVCIDLMSPAACSNAPANCKSIYGADSQLLQLSTEGILLDALYAMEL